MCEIQSLKKLKLIAETYLRHHKKSMTEHLVKITDRPLYRVFLSYCQRIGQRSSFFRLPVKSDIGKKTSKSL